MSRLIDEDTIIKMLNTMDRYTSEELTLCDTDETFPKNEVFIVDDVFEGLDELPSAQPEIVRCKDCDFWAKQEDSLQGRCGLFQMYPTGGWFCGSARRREETA